MHFETPEGHRQERHGLPPYNKPLATLTLDEKEQQKLVTAHFQGTAERWKTLYQTQDTFADIFQLRLSTALALIDKLSLAPGSEILDVGCGAGLASVALAQRGHMVKAVDVAPAMIKSTHDHAAQASVSHRVSASIGDIHHLAFPDNAFSVVLAIGVTSWLYSLDAPLREMARVLRPGGHLVISTANRWGLCRLLDPRFSPVFSTVVSMARRVIGLNGQGSAPRAAQYRLYSLDEFDRILSMATFQKVEGMTIGFGPFSFLGINFLPDFAGVSISRKLQRLAGRNVPLIKSTGKLYLVLARKCEDPLGPQDCGPFRTGIHNGTRGSRKKDRQ